MNFFVNRTLLVFSLFSCLVCCRKSEEPSAKAFSFSPANGVSGDEVTITVTGFDATSTNSQVIFNGHPAQIISTNQSQIHVTVPKGVTTGSVKLAIGGDTLTSSSVFTVLGTAQDIGTLKPGDVLVAGPGDRGGTIYKNGVRIENLCYPGAVYEWIAVDGNDVYAAGDLHGAATYWKNGVPLSPVEGSVWGRIHAIKVVNGKLYMVGMRREGGKNTATYWHDGIEDTLPSDNMPAADAWDIVVNGNDVHIVGATYSISTANGTSVGRYWKNGKLEAVNNAGNNSFFYSVAVAGNDVHIVGYRTLSGTNLKAACYWKNGIPAILSNTAKSAEAISIAVDGQDVYVAGWESKSSGPAPTTAMYWKNNVAVPLLEAEAALAIDVYGGNAYITGYNSIQNTSAFLWKNGEIMSFNQPQMKGSLGYYVYVVK